MKLYTSRDAAKKLGLHPNTLRKMADANTINTIRISGQRRYDVDSYLGNVAKSNVVCYCRVSSAKQKDDLERQVQFMRERYPTAEIVRDIGSGLNFKRKGLKAILERAMSGEQLTLVAAHRDRIARFGIEIIQQAIEHSSGSVVVLCENALSPAEELTKDLLNIVHVFSCRMHGLRNYKKQINSIISESKTEENTV